MTKTYDRAQTPYQRLLSHPGVLDEVDAHRLAAQLQATNPAAARRQVADLCSTLLARVRRKTVTRRAQTAAVYRSKIKINNRPQNRATPDESTTQTKQAS